MQAFKRILSQSGVRGLWRGWTGILVRASVGSSAQLSTFSKSKDLLMEYEFFADSIFYTALGASMVSGLFTAISMTPFDTVATRMFNQGEFDELLT
jgi:solute carrier family 25 protein 34/35